MVQTSPALATLRATLVNTGYLRNVAWDPPTTCRTCGGVPGAGYSQCLRCHDLDGLPDLADRLGFVVYAWPGHQSGRLMHGYKSPQATSEQVTMIATLLAYAVVAHQDCAGVGAPGRPDAWATVPSLRGRTGQHPLHRIAAPILRNLPDAALTTAPGANAARGYRPDNFRARPPLGSHVLLLDDTWTTGGRVQSAASALKRDGAARVTTLVLARWLEPSWAHTRDVISDAQRRYFDPDICPYTGGYC